MSSSRKALKFGKEGYDFTNAGRSAIPEDFRNMIIGKACIEFLRAGTDNIPVKRQNQDPNHAIIKFDLESPYDDYKGVRINMLPNWEIASDGEEDGPNYKLGRLFVKPVRYLGPARTSARTCWIAFKKGISLEKILDVIESKKLHRFFFIDLDDKYYGCRDFITQLVYQLQIVSYTKGTITWTEPQEPGLPANVTLAYHALGYRYMASPLGSPYPCLIDKGYFRDYKRVEAKSMAYQH